MKKPVTIESLKKFNWTAAGAHAAAFAGFAVIAFVFLKQQYKSASLYRIGVANTPNLNSLDYNTKIVRIGSINIPSWILAFFAFTVLFHVLYATDFFGRGWYTAFLKQGWNPVRWGEYAISASIMIGILSVLAGNRDFTSVLPNVLCVAALQVCGLLVERETIKAIPDLFQVNAATVMGWVLLLAAWAPIFFSIFTVIGDVRGFNSKVPSWIPAAVGVQFIMYSLFGIVQLRVVRALNLGLPLPNFLNVERAYIMLSFSSKLALGSFLGYGLLQRQNNPV